MTVQEAHSLSQYLVGKPASTLVISLYIKAVTSKKLLLTSEEQKLWNACLRYPILIRSLDSYFSVFKRESTIRKRLLLMHAILEAQPSLCEYFLPKNRTFFYWIVILFTGGLWLLQLVIGQIICKWAAYKWTKA